MQRVFHSTARAREQLVVLASRQNIIRLHTTDAVDDIYERMDYTLGIRPVQEPNNTIVVVECKQYKKASKKNFTAAAADYAKGRPNAQVFLASYGRLTAFLKQLNVEGRTICLEEIRPQAPNTSKFKFELVHSVLQYYRNCARFNNAILYPWGTQKSSCDVMVQWITEQVDLDLHLIVTEKSGEKHHISYANQGQTDVFPYVQLYADIVRGPAMETICISSWLDATYDIYVDIFSGILEQKDSILALLRCGQDDDWVVCKEKIGENQCWHIFRISRYGYVKINAIESQNWRWN